MWEVVDVKKNSSWPRIEPCGTPESTGVQLEAQPFMTTRCLHWVKKALNHYNLEYQNAVVLAAVIHVAQYQKL